jgi:hypothetical protein
MTRHRTATKSLYAPRDVKIEKTEKLQVIEPGKNRP